MDFPIETTFRDDDLTGVIRLKVAAICACLDNDFAGRSGTRYEQEELEPFLQKVEMTSASGKKTNKPPDPHSFLYLQPTGNLKADVEDVLNALKTSIDKGQLNTVFLKIGLDGVIDAVNTWISTKEFYKWCVSRGIEHGDICLDYDDGEYYIFDHASENANGRRKQFETPYFDAGYKTRLGNRSDPDQIPRAEYEEILLENMILRQGMLPPDKTDELPLNTRERNVLLSIIAVLCNRSKYDYTRAAKIAGIIKDDAEEMGIYIGESTIEGHLKKIPDALSSRMR